jgi:hypothetical protein
VATVVSTDESSLYEWVDDEPVEVWDDERAVDWMEECEDDFDVKVHAAEQFHAHAMALVALSGRGRRPLRPRPLARRLVGSTRRRRVRQRVSRRARAPGRSDDPEPPLEREPALDRGHRGRSDGEVHELIVSEEACGCVRLRCTWGHSPQQIVESLGLTLDDLLCARHGGLP